MPSFYVAARPKAEHVAAGFMPHTSPTQRHMHFEREKEAQGYLNGLQHQDPYYVNSDGKTPITFGPDKTELTWPRMEMIYRVEIEKPEKLADMKSWETQLPGIGTAGRTTLDPTMVLSRTTTIYPDALHEKAWVHTDEPHFGEHIKDAHITEQMMQRGQDLQRMYRILERSGPKEQEMLDMRNPEHADMMRRVCIHNKPEGDLAEQTLQVVQRQIAAETGVRTVLSMTQIQAEFNAQLEALPAETPEAERVAVAMEGTLAKFSASVPARDTGAVAKVQSQVRGTIHELEAEMNGRDITAHELGEQQLERTMEPHLRKLTQEEREEFDRLYQEHYSRATANYNDEQAKAVAAMAAMQEMREGASPEAQKIFADMAEAVGLIDDAEIGYPEELEEDVGEHDFDD